MRALVFDLGGPLVTETHQLPPVVTGTVTSRSVVLSCFRAPTFIIAAASA